MDLTVSQIINMVSFHQAAIISLSVFIADFITGITAALRSGRHIKSSVMHQTLSKKITNYFYFLIIGLSFYIASSIGSSEAPLELIATIVVMIPAMPELLSLWENFKIIRSSVDTKPKE